MVVDVEKCRDQTKTTADLYPTHHHRLERSFRIVQSASRQMIVDQTLPKLNRVATSCQLDPAARDLPEDRWKVRIREILCLRLI